MTAVEQITRVADSLIGSVSSSPTGIGSLINGFLPGTSDPAEVSAFYAAVQTTAGILSLTVSLEGKTSLADKAMTIKSAILDRRNLIVATKNAAAKNGFILPDDPFVFVDIANSKRAYGDPVDLDEKTCQQLVTDMSELSKVAADFKSGVITFQRTAGVIPAHALQLASYETSVDGISKQSGDPLTDILGYQPDGDLVKQKRASDALNLLDFSKRKPHLLFVMDVIRPGGRSGTVVCWMKMHDASGYYVKRRDVFKNIDLPLMKISSAEVDAKTKRLLTGDAQFSQVLSFYDWLSMNDVCAVDDGEAPFGTLCSYTVSGYQTKSPGTPAIFDVQTSALYLQQMQFIALAKDLVSEAQRFGIDSVTTISPYSALSRVVFGDPGFDWIIAGCNVTASKKRGDSSTTTRTFSYVGSTIDGLTAAIKAGHVVIPKSISTVQKAVESSIMSYGVSQTLLTILEGTGLTQYISGKDDPLGIAPSQSALERSTDALARVIASVDPTTMVVDPSVVVANLTSPITTASGHQYVTKIVPEIDVRTNISSPVDLVGKDPIDLTTYLGISRFIRLIRAIYDFSPGTL